MSALYMNSFFLFHFYGFRKNNRDQYSPNAAMKIIFKKAYLAPTNFSFQQKLKTSIQKSMIQILSKMLTA